MSAATRTLRTVLGNVNVYDAYNLATHEHEGYVIPGAVMREAARLQALVGHEVVIHDFQGTAFEATAPMVLHSVAIAGGYVGDDFEEDDVPHIQVSASDADVQNLYAGALYGATVEAA